MLGLRTARERARLATLVLLLLVASVAAVATTGAHNDKETDRSLERRTAVVTALDEARADTFLLAAQFAASLFSEDTTPLQDTYPRADVTIREDMQAARAALIAMGEMDEVAAIDNVSAQLEGLMQDADVVALLTSTDPDARADLGKQYYSEIWPRVETMMADLNQLARGQQSKLADERAAAGRTADVTLALLIGFSVFAFLAGTAALTLLIMSILRPLASLQANAKAVTSGDLEARAEVSGPEEVASLARAFNEMTEALLERTTGLEESERRYHQLFEELNDAAFLADSETGILLDANRGAETLLGHTRDEMIGMHQSKLHPAEKAEEYKQRFAAHVEKGHAADYDGEVVRKDGTVVPVAISTTVMTLGGRHLILGLFHDISERKQAEETLREGEAKYRQIFENVQDIFFRTDAQGILTELSPSVKDWGYSREELIGTQVLNIYEDPEERAGLLKTLLEQGEVRHYEIRLRAGDGRVIDASVNSLILRDPDGTFIGVEGTLRDVSEQKRAEDALRESEERFRNVLDVSRDLIYKLNLETKSYDYVSPSALQLLGFTPEEVVAMGLKGVIERFHPEDKERFRTSSDNLPDGTVEDRRAPAIEYRWKCKDGRYRWFSDNRAFVRDDDGRTLAMVGTVRDITERKRAEDEKQKAHENTVMLLALAAETRDPFTENHLQRIRGYTEAIASELRLSTQQTREIGLASLLHDLGKMRVPDSILTKPGPLSDEEWELMEKHTLWGEEMLPEQPQFETARQIARWHHENWDGTGYPDGLRGQEIPLSAAIVAVADGFDAMISERPYKRAWPPERAVKEIRTGKNQRYSPRVVEAFERALAKGEIKRVTMAGAPKASDEAKAA